MNTIRLSFVAVVLLSVTPALIYALGQVPRANEVFYVPAALYVVCMWVGYLMHKRVAFALAACVAMVAVALSAGYLANVTLNLLNMATFGCVGFAFMAAITSLAVGFTPGNKEKGESLIIFAGSGAMIAAMVGISFF